ncbi:uncharacterized protein SPSK_02039 [Sporothrix schenckii 1099-18]|uniref:Uncharacterized protein n=1 Tax=Sporothrix schenckii 1099-18 TaxID=1397361 RepID=A0A0F2MCW2_SPOSC|nr:uncharacterized protein SPSK_02039 [Sporothrix schenckii 1099-18]KJR87472.1 hypothetical protein SPSK_02039 [Sporothrix schenckii 1099-18]
MWRSFVERDAETRGTRAGHPDALYISPCDGSQLCRLIARSSVAQGDGRCREEGISNIDAALGNLKKAGELEYVAAFKTRQYDLVTMLNERSKTREDYGFENDGGELVGMFEEMGM